MFNLNTIPALQIAKELNSKIVFGIHLNEMLMCYVLYSVDCALLLDPIACLYVVHQVGDDVHHGAPKERAWTAPKGQLQRS